MTRIIIPCLLLFAASCGRQPIQSQSEFFGKWEKISDVTADEKTTTFKPGEVILEYFNGGEMFAHYDGAKYPYRYTVKNGTILTQTGSDGVHRVFEYKFNEDQSRVTMRQQANGIKSSFRRLK